jgi:hypothetical protein
MSSDLFSFFTEFFYKHKFHLISLSTSLLFLMTTIQRYHRLRNQYEHYERREKMLHSILIQKQDELENLIDYINQLQIQSSICVYDHGDHLSMPSMISLERFSMDEDDESDNDPLLQRLKLTKPSRLKTSLKSDTSTD